MYFFRKYLDWIEKSMQESVKNPTEEILAGNGSENSSFPNHVVLKLPE